MRSISQSLIALLLLASSLLISSCGISEDYTAVRGVIDLRDYDFENHIDLDGEWQFVWQDSSSGKISDPKTYVNIDVPDAWNGYMYEDQEIPAHGYGSYYLTILLPDFPAEYAIDFPTAGTAYNLFVNGTLIGGVGICSPDPERGEPAYQATVYELGQHSNQLNMRIEVSNHHHRLGGLWESISLGHRKDIIHKRENQVAMQLFMVGAIFIMGFYHLGVFSLDTRGLAALYFGIFCLFIGLRTLTTGEIFLHEVWPSLSWANLVKLEYLTFYMGISVFFSFIQLQFPDEIKSWAAKIVLVVSSLFSLLVLFSSV
ncbi:7TM-DISM domain-containing protein, partial [bacterium]|nr:7TM-DISM domain-containing protein [bacterium]